jgi:hypothetical protein
MSEAYEGVVFRSDERTARCAFGSLASRLRLRLVRLARGVFGIYRVAGRNDAFDQPAVERVAQRRGGTLSLHNSTTVWHALRYSEGRARARRRPLSQGSH